MPILGIDIGGTSVKAAALEAGRFLWTGQSPFYSRPTTAQLRDAIKAAVANRISSLDAVGLCVPGLLDPATRQITLAVNVPGLVGIPLDLLVPQSLDLHPDAVRNPRATLLNDAGAAAVDIFKTHRLHGRLLVLSLGTGVGAAVLDDGKPLHIEGDSPGHIGQIDVSVPGHPVIGPDGGAGGLEGYIGAPALRKHHGDNLPAALQQFTGEEPPITALVQALRIAHAIYRPAHICLCGGIGIRLQHLLPIIRRKIEQNLTTLARPNWTLTTGQTDFHAARGAAHSAEFQAP